MARTAPFLQLEFRPRGRAAQVGSTACGSFPAVGITGALFEENGYTTLAPGWPDDRETVEEAQHDVVRIASSSATK
jgi:hypothetical protein